MNWTQLEWLRRVVDSGSFTEAARQAGVSQPAVSQAMKQLAQQVSGPLFQREGRRQVPTALALRLARAMQGVDVALQAAAGPGPAPAGEPVVRVGMAPAAGLLYGALMVQALAGHPRRPRLSIETGPAPAMLDALARGELDAVISPRPRGLEGAELRQHLMYISRPAIYCRKGHPLAGATSLGQITQAQWAVAGRAGTPGNVIEEAFRVRHWPAPQIAVQCSDYGMLVQIVAASDLLAVISHPRLAPQPQRLGITPIRVKEGLPHYEVCLFWHPRPRRGAFGLRRVIAALIAAGADESTPMPR